MLYIKSFSNYEEFLELFGVREFDGRKARKNKILLSLLKDKNLFKEAVKSGDLSLFAITNLVDLRNELTKRIRKSGARSSKLPYSVTLLGNTYYSDKYNLDELEGICEDGTPNAVRYHNNESDRIFKMKCGKFMKHLIEATKFGKTLNETLLIWLCEEFSMEWQSHVIGQLPKNKLYVNDNFADIYDSKRLKGYDTDNDSFVSCMVNRGYHTFYKDAVSAKAAYLEDETGMIIARCIIFTEVHEKNSDKTWRYAERQYSVGCNDIYKRALIDALIEAGEIDCYKKIGASCHEPSAIVDVNGNSLADKCFYIDCNLRWDEPLSYQDTFKWYDSYHERADNYECGSYQLDVTEGSLEAADEDNDPGPEEYDSYHERDAYEVCDVYYHGEELTCDVDSREEFTYFHGRWYHEDDLVKCPICEQTMLNPKYYKDEEVLEYSNLTGEYYCCEDCLERAEDNYREDNMYYSDYDDEWYHSASNVTTYMKYNCITFDYEEKTISKLSLLEGYERGEFHKFIDRYYDIINEEIGKPYGLETIIEFAV